MSHVQEEVFSDGAHRESGSEECVRRHRTGEEGQASARAGSYSANGTSNPEALCATHGEGLKLFCQNDEEVLCCVCQTSKKHQGHSVCPLEEAANDLKVMINF